MRFASVIIREAFPPAFALLIILTLAELVEPGFTAGAVNLPILTVAVVMLGLVRTHLDRSRPPS